MKRFILAALVGVLVSGPVHALPTYKNADSAEQRLALLDYAEKALYLDILSKQVPQISPAERKLLDSEMQSGDTKRKIRAVESSEYWIKQTNELVDVLKNNIKTLRSNLNDYAAWTWFAYSLSGNRMEYPLLLCKRKILKPCFQSMEYQTDLLQMVGSQISRTILVGVLGRQFGTGFPK